MDKTDDKFIWYRNEKEAFNHFSSINFSLFIRLS